MKKRHLESSIKKEIQKREQRDDNEQIFSVVKIQGEPSFHYSRTMGKNGELKEGVTLCDLDYSNQKYREFGLVQGYNGFESWIRCYSRQTCGECAKTFFYTPMRSIRPKIKLAG